MSRLTHLILSFYEPIVNSLNLPPLNIRNIIPIKNHNKHIQHHKQNQNPFGISQQKKGTS